MERVEKSSGTEPMAAALRGWPGTLPGLNSRGQVGIGRAAGALCVTVAVGETLVRGIRAWLRGAPTTGDVLLDHGEDRPGGALGSRHSGHPAVRRPNSLGRRECLLDVAALAAASLPSGCVHQQYQHTPRGPLCQGDRLALKVNVMSGTMTCKKSVSHRIAPNPAAQCGGLTRSADPL